MARKKPKYWDCKDHSKNVQVMFKSVMDFLVYVDIVIKARNIHEEHFAKYIKSQRNFVKKVEVCT